MSDQEVLAEFLDLVGDRMDLDRVRSIADQALAMENGGDVRQLMGLVTGAVGRGSAGAGAKAAAG